MEQTFYLKYNDVIVAELYTKNAIPETMEILEPKYFYDRFDKAIMNSTQIKNWIIDRIRPETQVGFTKLMKVLNIDIDSSLWYWDVFKATNGLNIKDRLYFTDNKDGNSPWEEILVNDTCYEKIGKYLNLTYSNNSVNMIGACEKKLVRINGKLGLLKKTLQHNTYDNACEEIAYKIAEILGVPCSPAICLDSVSSVSFIDENINLQHAEDFLKIDEVDLKIIYRRLCKKNIDKRVKIDFLRMFLFDILTRQVDRNVTNFGFYKVNDYVKLYRMYDNGLCLFSGTKIRESLSYNYLYGNSLENLKFIIKELKEEKIMRAFPGEIDNEILEEIFKPFEEIIKSKNGNEIKDIIKWTMKMYNHILEEYNKPYIL